MKDFTYIGRPARVVFGAGKLRERPVKAARRTARLAPGAVGERTRP